MEQQGLKNRLQSGISRSYRMEINKGASTLSRASAIADKGGMLKWLIWMALKVKVRNIGFIL